MDAVTIPLADVSVMYGIPAGHKPPWETALSLAATAAHCERLGVPLVPGVVKGCSIITSARDRVLDEFLQSDCNRLFWIDADIEWTTPHFLRLVALSQVVDVVGATYPAKLEPPTFFVNHGDLSNLKLGEYGLVEVEGMGLGFTIMRREVVESLVRTKPRYLDELSGRTLAAVFRTDTHEGKFRGEDMALFADVRALGYKVWLDPAVQLWHHGEKRYAGKFLDAFELKESAC